MKLKKIRWRVLRDQLRAENSLGILLEYFVCRRLRRQKIFKLKIRGEQIFVRTLSRDLEVALHSLGGEFRELEGLFPRDHAGLIIDAGGYIGTAAIALSRMYPEATVITIEPASENFEILRRNIEPHPRIVAHNAAVVPFRSGEPVALMNRGKGQVGFTVVKSPLDRTATFVEQVAGVCIPEILNRYPHDRIMIIKMDIEGAEYELFKEDSWLEKCDALMIELHERIVPGCEQAFRDASKSRLVYATDGEKFLSLAPSLGKRAGVQA